MMNQRQTLSSEFIANFLYNLIGFTTDHLTFVTLLTAIYNYTTTFLFVKLNPNFFYS